MTIEEIKELFGGAETGLSRAFRQANKGEASLVEKLKEVLDGVTDAGDDEILGWARTVADGIDLQGMQVMPAVEKALRVCRLRQQLGNMQLESLKVYMADYASRSLASLKPFLETGAISQADLEQYVLQALHLNERGASRPAIEQVILTILRQ